MALTAPSARPPTVRLLTGFQKREHKGRTQAPVAAKSERQRPCPCSRGCPHGAMWRLALPSGPGGVGEQVGCVSGRAGTTAPQPSETLPATCPSAHATGSQRRWMHTRPAHLQTTPADVPMGARALGRRHGRENSRGGSAAAARGLRGSSCRRGSQYLSREHWRAYVNCQLFTPPRGCYEAVLKRTLLLRARSELSLLCWVVILQV